MNRLAGRGSPARCPVIRFAIPMIPVSKGRPRAVVVGGHARVFTPKKTERAECEFAAFAAPYAPTVPFDGAVTVQFVFVLPIPSSGPLWLREARERGAHYPRGPKDTDNLAKLALDALSRSGRFWRNDAQVVQIQASKTYGLAPETRVEIAFLREPTREEWKAQSGGPRGAPAPLPLFRKANS